MSQKILFKGIRWHSSRWVVFHNGKLAKPRCGMAYHRSPLLIMVYFQKALLDSKGEQLVEIYYYTSIHIRWDS